MSSIKYKIWMLLPLMAMISCESILDKFPEDKITPETFFTTENELELYSNNFLSLVFRVQECLKITVM